jgi:hypothetical protein
VGESAFRRDWRTQTTQIFNVTFHQEFLTYFFKVGFFKWHDGNGGEGIFSDGALKKKICLSSPDGERVYFLLAQWKKFLAISIQP